MVPGDWPDLLALLATARPSWHADAACREHPELSWHPELGESAAAAKAVCSGCLVVDECLAYAVAGPSLGGIWGATSARERGGLRRARTRSNAA